jgi:acylphosphatase
MQVCVRCYVSGRVQGVGYRFYTHSKALQLGLTGYARNLDDGRVEVLACGEETAVTALREWLWRGPRWARVTDVQWEHAPVEYYDDFTTD